MIEQTQDIRTEEQWDTALSTEECAQLAAYEAIIEAGREMFAQMGAALTAIRDERLYRRSHRSFDLYLSERWGFTRQRAHQLIDAASVAKNLSTVVDTGKLNERQARVLAPLMPDEQRVVYQVARGTAPAGRITASHLKALSETLGDIAAAGAIDDGSGHMVPWDDLPPVRKRALFEANVTEQAYERLERQRQRLTSSASTEWYTPVEYLEAVQEVLGAIDLDPASCPQANETVRAARYLTADDDGLAHDWPGRVFLNPPYAGRAGEFVTRLLDQYARGITTAAVLLVSAVPTGSTWFRPLLTDWPLCFAGRVPFISEQGVRTPAFSSTVFAYIGTEQVRFAKVFARFGPILRHWTVT